MKLDWSDPTEQCPKCGSRVIQIAACGHGYCLMCKFTWNHQTNEVLDMGDKIK